MSEPVTFYFSFRSPYTWLSCVRLRRLVPAWDLDLDWVPVYPPDPSLIASTSSDVRIAYTREDVTRVAEAYGLEPRWPEQHDTDWIRPHACVYYAADRGALEAFVEAAFHARFGEGRDLGADETLREVAARVGLDPDAVLAAAGDPDHQKRVVEPMIKGVREGALFGVPTFVWQGRHFWGNDRLDWLLRAVAESRGQRVPDLAADPLAPPAA